MVKLTRHEQLSVKYRQIPPRAKGREHRLNPDTINNLLDLTSHNDPKIRCEAVRSLCPCHVQANHDQIWDRLIAMVDDPDVKVRSTILHALGDGSPRAREADVIRALEKMYSDPDPGLRRRVRGLLAQYRRTGKINVL